MASFLEVQKISKSFPGVKALDEVSINFNNGEVHGLVGLNGSGKSTLMKILGGVFRQDSGEIILDGEKQKFYSVTESRKAGISLVYQELSLVNDMSIAENIFLGHHINKIGFISMKEMMRQATELLDILDIKINAGTYVSSLTVAEKQMIEIVKALSINERVLLLDEPTSVLTENETVDLFKLLNSLKAKGVTIIYVTHRLKEIFEISDAVSVLRDGRLIGTAETSKLDSSELIKMVVGHNIVNLFPEHMDVSQNKKVLEVKNLKSSKLGNIDMVLYEKEIVGVFGAPGSGQKELAESLFGVYKGVFRLDDYKIFGKSVKIKNAFHAIKNSLAYVPGERKEEGLMVGLTVRENCMITVLERLKNWFGAIRKSIEKKRCNDLINNLDIQTSSQEVIVINLSGGNQQKIVIGKWLETNSKILLFVEPTRGIDVNSKAHIYQTMENIRQKGVSIIIMSSELSEIIGMVDRLYVIKKGEIVGLFNKNEMHQELILSRAIGLEVKKDEVFI